MVKSIKKEMNNFKIIIIGLDNAGKSTILSKYLGISQLPPPTFGYKVHSKIHSTPDGDFDITFLDIGGQASFKKYWNNYFESTDAAIFIIDSTDSRPISEYFNEIMGLCTLSEIPVAIFCNKSDLNTNFSMPEIIKNSSDNIKIKCFKHLEYREWGLKKDLIG